MQVSEKITAFKGRLRESLDGFDRDAVEKKGLEAQFDQLFWRPLVDLPFIHDGQLSVVIIIDALDECDRPGHFSRLFTALRRLCTISTVRFRVLITSRPEVVNSFDFLQKTKSVRTLRMMDRDLREDAMMDIKVFLRKRFADVSSNPVFRLEAWPSPKDFDRLVQLSTTPEPLFIYAATLCRFVCNGRLTNNPKRQLRIWLNQCDENKSQLNQMYEPVLRQVCLESDEAEINQLLRLLAAIILVKEPLSAATLAYILDIETYDVHCWLQGLHAVLDVPSELHRPIRLLHKSFSDFLLNNDDMESRKYCVDATESHAMLAAKCIQRMKQGLRRDICNTQKPDLQRDEIDKEVLDTSIPADLRYACLYWVYHLQQSEGSLGDDVYMFLNTHLLHWLEVLGLIGNAWDGVAAIKQLLKMCQVSSSVVALYLG